MTLEHATYCDELVRQTTELRPHLVGADLSAKVPTCPDWTLRELVVHVGGAHRWVHHIVSTKALEPVKPEQVVGAADPRATTRPPLTPGWPRAPSSAPRRCGTPGPI